MLNKRAWVVRTTNTWTMGDNRKPEIKLPIYSQLTFHKKTTLGKRELLINGAVKTGYSMKKNETVPLSLKNQKWTKDLNVKPQIMKLIQLNIIGSTSRHWVGQGHCVGMNSKA